MTAPVAAGALPTREEVRAAFGRIGAHVRRTPLTHAPAISRRAGREVWLKQENLQRTGSFKFRGALNALLVGSSSTPIAAASAGNHAFALAEAARIAGRRAVLFVPRGAPSAKLRGIRSAGGEVRLVDGGYDEAEDAAAAWARETPGVELVHAFDDDRVVAGQGTLGLEILAQHGGARSIVAPVGGGGLLAGLHAAVPPGGPRLLGVQGDRTRAMHDAIAARRLVPTDVVDTLMDGLAGRTTEGALGRLLAADARVELVPESAVADAIRTLHGFGVRAEGSGAVSVAALLARVVEPPGPVVAIVSGGNIDDATLDAVLSGER